MKKSRGFTLIEVLVVMVIIGIITAVAVMAFGDFGRARKLKMQAQQLAQLITLIKSQAQLQTSLLGLAIKGNRLRLYQFTSEKHWQQLKDSAYMNVPIFADGTKLKWVALTNKSGAAPQVLFWSTGEMSRFVLRLCDASKKCYWIGQNKENDIVVREKNENDAS